MMHEERRVADTQQRQTSPALAHRLRHARETESTQFRPGGLPGVERTRQLFCIYSLLTFDDDIPQSQMDLVLDVCCETHAHEELLRRELTAAGRCAVVILAAWLPLAELSRATPEQACQATRSGSLEQLGEASLRWRRRADTPLYRMRNHAYYLVGLHEGDSDDDSCVAELPATKQAIADHVERKLGISPRVEVAHFDAFFNGLHEGRWHYQLARLEETLRAVRNQPEAMESAQLLTLHVEHSGHRHCANVSFPFPQPGGEAAVTLRLCGLPGHDPGRTLASVRATVERVGGFQIRETPAIDRAARVARFTSERRQTIDLSMAL